MYRLAYKHEVNVIDELNRQMLIETYGLSWINNVINSQGAGILVSIVEKQIVGYLIYALKYNKKGDLYTEIVSLAISPDHRRHGHARNLLELAEKKSQEMKVEIMGLYVRKSNKGARKLYANMGYNQLKKIKNMYKEGKSEDGTIYSKEDGFFMQKHL